MQHWWICYLRNMNLLVRFLCNCLLMTRDHIKILIDNHWKTLRKFISNSVRCCYWQSKIDQYLMRYLFYVQSVRHFSVIMSNNVSSIIFNIILSVFCAIELNLKLKKKITQTLNYAHTFWTYGIESIRLGLIIQSNRLLFTFTILFKWEKANERLCIQIAKNLVSNDIKRWIVFQLQNFYHLKLQ